ncbi:unnamed protein product [Arabis nemorensis]|uniref:Disease resistance R13L4/SHOC-2-like LRR domain-containing protein n=1 Tax=Arabis nemorensis TaxID=586526 RepID=A0A565CFN0_9BRAS|nr:unnamed protein product [Arabis nemorensis]
MASIKAHQSGNTLEDKVDKILETLLTLDKWEEKRGITERSKTFKTLSRTLSDPYAWTHVASDGKLVMMLQHHFRLLKRNLGKLEQFQTDIGAELDKHLVTLQSLIKDLNYFGFSSELAFLIKLDLEGIERKISGLFSQFPLLSESQDDGDKGYYYLPGIHTNVEGLIKCEAFRRVKQKFMELEIEQKICLLSFAVFPENREVHRTVLMYWWIGEGILPVEGAEEAVREVLKEFTEKNLVEPVEERRKVAPSSYKMTPFVHSSVVLLSNQIGVFDIYGEGCRPSMHMSDKEKIFIVEESAIQREATARKRPSEDIETVFNVSERNPDYAIKWFSRDPRRLRGFTMNSSPEPLFKSLNVFYLGRWERSQKRQIEVHNHELMECLRYVREVKVLSLQGISTIKSLNRSLCNLHQLIVLDLRECYELTELPDKIDYLKNLVYLDMTGCSRLKWIPSRLSLLNNLEVLKGFVVTDAFSERVACKLIYLKPKLRKLSIEIKQDNFSVRQLMLDLENLNALTSLKVTWCRDPDSPRRKPTVGVRVPATPAQDPVPNGVGVQLKKLNLQRFPDEELAEWFYPEKLIHLKKLCIGGGKKLKGFGKYLPEEPTKCAVEVLRLTSLPKLRVGWIELKQLYFPKLTFLEKYECPRVSLTPCDGNGIWRSDQD